jgi:hypothetical protein
MNASSVIILQLAEKYSRAQRRRPSNARSTCRSRTFYFRPVHHRRESRAKEPGATLAITSRTDREAFRQIVRPNIMTTPPTAPTIDATGMNVSGPK